jgi:hypothetical protein
MPSLKALLPEDTQESVSEDADKATADNVKIKLKIKI